MKKMPESDSGLSVGKTADQSLMWSCVNMLTVDEQILTKHIADYFIRQDVASLLAHFMRHTKRLFPTTLRLREREMGPLPNPDGETGSDEHEDDKGAQKIDFTHPLIKEWLKSKQDAKYMLLKAALAEEILDGISQELGIDEARKLLEKCAGQESSKKMLLSAIAKCLERIEDIIGAQFEIPLKQAFLIAQSRMNENALLS